MANSDSSIKKVKVVDKTLKVKRKKVVKKSYGDIKTEG